MLPAAAGELDKGSGRAVRGALCERQSLSEVPAEHVHMIKRVGSEGSDTERFSSESDRGGSFTMFPQNGSSCDEDSPPSSFRREDNENQQAECSGEWGTSERGLCKALGETLRVAAPPASPESEEDAAPKQALSIFQKTLELTTGNDHLKELEDAEGCSICLEAFSQDDPAKVTVCGHCYHLQCIMQWRQRSSECPMCLRRLKWQDPDVEELVEALAAPTISREYRVSMPFALYRLHAPIAHASPQGSSSHGFEPSISNSEPGGARGLFKKVSSIFRGAAQRATRR